MKKIASFIKSLILFFRPGSWSGFLINPLLWLSNIIRLSRWISGHPIQGMNDFFSPWRDYGKRYLMYENVIGLEKLDNEPIDYLEFGVSAAHSFRWWIKNNVHPQSRFYGFDTFEGLPEKWGQFEKGSLSAGIPTLEDSRHEFIKGLFSFHIFNLPHYSRWHIKLSAS